MKKWWEGMERTFAYFSREGCLKIDASHFNLQNRFRRISISRMAAYTRLKSWEDKNNEPASRALAGIHITTRTAGRRLESNVDRYIVRQSVENTKKAVRKMLTFLATTRPTENTTSSPTATASGRSEPSRAAATATATTAATAAAAM